MNNDHDNNFLENLFEQARVNQPVIDDAGFSASVMAALPKEQPNEQLVQQPHQLLSSVSNKKRFNWYDAIGLGVGALACFTIIEPSHLVSLVDNVLPDRLVLSPLSLLSASVAMAALAFTGWQVLEGDLAS